MQFLLTNELQITPRKAKNVLLNGLLALVISLLDFLSFPHLSNYSLLWPYDIHTLWFSRTHNSSYSIESHLLENKNYHLYYKDNGNLLNRIKLFCTLALYPTSYRQGTESKAHFEEEHEAKLAVKCWIWDILYIPNQHMLFTAIMHPEVMQLSPWSVGNADLRWTPKPRCFPEHSRQIQIP